MAETHNNLAESAATAAAASVQYTEDLNTIQDNITNAEANGENQLAMAVKSTIDLSAAKVPMDSQVSMSQQNAKATTEATGKLKNS